MAEQRDMRAGRSLSGNESSRPPGKPDPSGAFRPFSLSEEFTKQRDSGNLRLSWQGVEWYIFLHRGRVTYASHSLQSPGTLDFYLRCWGQKAAAERLKSEPQFQLAASSPILRRQPPPRQLAHRLNWLEEQGAIDKAQKSQLVSALSVEAIEPFFWLQEGNYSWTPGDISDRPEILLDRPQDFADLAGHYRTRLQQWQTLEEKIWSPYQRAYLFARDRAGQTSPLLEKISKFLRGLTIAQLAVILRQDAIETARLLYPYIEAGEIYLREPQSPFNRLPEIPSRKESVEELPHASEDHPSPRQRYRIVCIDDSPAILDAIGKFLSSECYEIFKIASPLQAVSTLLEVNPHLILMDITMPGINGYQLCSTLRESESLREVPIVMVTGRTGIIDKARARMNGANDYLTKPFTKGELLLLIEKYLPSPSLGS